VSPRKSSTSSVRPEPRPASSRYLGLEVAGEPVPPNPSSRWASWLAEGLAAAGAASLPIRLVRSEGGRAVVRVPAHDALTARRALDGASVARGSVVLRTVRTWGTLVGAKAWLAAAPPPRAAAARAAPGRSS
jgi:hypothetical protein